MTAPSERHRLFAALYPLQRIWEPLGMWRHRRAVCGGATGTTLEIGIGTGFSLPYYRVQRLIACDPNLNMLRAAKARARKARMDVSFVVASAEALPFDDRSFETVTSCMTFCTIEDRDRAISEIGRVLAADGQFRFVEHGRSSRPVLAAFQDAITPASRFLFAGCRMNRDSAPPLGQLELKKVRRCSAGTVARGTAVNRADAGRPVPAKAGES
ncbi:MAG: hypothetical protein NVSMB57_16870 [Actinomycetota bacterium]